MNIKGIKRGAILLCIFAVIGLTALAIWQYNEYIDTNEYYQTKQRELSDIKSEITEIERMLASYEKEKEEFAKFLFDERDIPAFLDDISKFAKEETVEIIDMKTKKFRRVQLPGDVENKRQRDLSKKKKNQSEVERRKELRRILTLSSMPIKVKLEGDFYSLTKFMNHLQGYQQLINVSDVEIKVTKFYPVLDCRFTINIYSLKSLAELGTK